MSLALHIVSRQPNHKNDMEVHTMTIINLRDFYYWYTQNEYIEVTDDVAETLRARSFREIPLIKM